MAVEVFLGGGGDSRMVRRLGRRSRVGGARAGLAAAERNGREDVGRED